MIKQIILLILLFSINCYTLDNHPIYTAIKILRPSIDNDFAITLSNHIHNNIYLKGLDPYLAVSIAMQESTISHKVVSKNGQINDIGIFQINVRTAKAYRLDISKMLDNDLKYITKAYTIIMKDKINKCRNLGQEAWSCYHSRTNKHRARYIKHVMRYYNKIRGEME